MFTEIKKTIPTGKDIYIQANFIGSALPPIKLNGIYSSANATDIKITVKDSSNNILVNSQSPTSTTGDNWVYDLTGTTLSLR